MEIDQEKEKTGEEGKTPALLAPPKQRYLPPHHAGWLSVHPLRTYDWLRGRIEDGFHVHHMDGNPKNNDPSNLLLIDGIDHMRLHTQAKRELKAILKDGETKAAKRGVREAMRILDKYVV